MNTADGSPAKPNQPLTWSTTQGDGNPALADFIAQDPDHETYVFRKFKRLAVRSVLYLQGELTALEEEIARLEIEAAKSPDPEVYLSMRSWGMLDENAQKPGRKKSVECRLHQLNRTLDGKLKTYCSLVSCSSWSGDPSLMPICVKTRRSRFSAMLRCLSLRVPGCSRRCANGCTVLRACRTCRRSWTEVTGRCSASRRIWWH